MAIYMGRPEVVQNERLPHCSAQTVSDGRSSISMATGAIVTVRSGNSPLPRPGAGVPRSRTPLPAWRLRRVVAHVDAHLEDPITLADLASVAGLSRMHFAAQFRVATGLRPHEYLLRRRIDHARQLLAEPHSKLVDVALSVGFQTQAHFTTVFKRIVGETPHRWRCAIGNNGDPSRRRGDRKVARPTSEPRTWQAEARY